uniref:Uncharacterized protein n=1 Tax=Triticum urartu TaxID=4572 RepID=A0A8R7TLE9_TRIUA
MVSVWLPSYFYGSSQIERLDTSYENLVVKICLPQDTLFCMKEICIKFLEALSKSRLVCQCLTCLSFSVFPARKKASDLFNLRDMSLLSVLRSHCSSHTKC